MNAAKAPLASPTFTGTVVLPTTTQIGSGSEGDIVTGTELGYLNGVTSAIQTQINAKANAADPAFTGTPSGVILGGTYTPTLDQYHERFVVRGGGVPVHARRSGGDGKRASND